MIFLREMMDNEQLRWGEQGLPTSNEIGFICRLSPPMIVVASGEVTLD